VALFVAMAFLLPLGMLALWADDTIYNSDSFSRRAVQLLDSPVAQKELATQITDQLAQAGYRPAVEFRPAFLFGVEVAVGTDVFRSIFRDAIKQFHAGLLAGKDTGAGLNLADALSVITSTVQLPSDAQGPTGGASSLGDTLQSVTQKLSDLRIWDLDAIMTEVALGALGLAVLVAIAGVAVAVDRRKAVLRLGLAVAVSGVLLLVLRWGVLVAVDREIDDHALANAMEDGLSHATNDLRLIGVALVSYGAVIAAAVSRARLMPSDIAARLRGWSEALDGRRRAWVVPAVVLIVAGIIVGTATSGAIELFVYLAGLYLVYLGVHRIVVHIHAPMAPDSTGATPVGHEGRRLVMAATAVVVILALTATGFVIVTRRAASRAEAAGARECNGSADFCDAPLDDVVFPGTHNSMSSSLYPGWLFGEQIATITGQLESGVRALLIDTHYGEATNVRIPGSDTPLVVTDRAAELAAPPGGDDDADLDPELQQRAQALAARQPPNAQAKRAIYLCHNYCELGAVLFSSAMTEVKTFLDTHPDQVVLLDIQDATTPADTAAVLEATGLADYAFTLDDGPLPTLGHLVDENKRLLVFAEQGGTGAPAWYMRMYDWFQETAYSFTSPDLFTCRPNRGASDNPLFLLNHWVSVSPPDPTVAATANSKEVLEQRLETCAGQRFRLPNVVAVDFSTQGQVVNEVKELNDAVAQLRESLNDRDAASPPTTSAPSSTTSTSATTTTTVQGSTTTLPSPVQTPVTTLTGGDPTAFCANYTDRYLILSDYSIAALSDGKQYPGQADFAYGPLLVGTIADYISVAPQELATLVLPLQQRVQAAVDTLKALGVQDNVIQDLADIAKDAYDRGIDPLGIEHDNITDLQSQLGADTLAKAGQDFVATHGDPSVAVDLGDVSNDAAIAAGYTCLTKT
jgi:hypothetical protein